MRKFFWEFLQNWPLIGGFLFGYQSFHNGDLLISLLIVLAGALSGALLIRYTEKYIIDGPVESPKVTIGNVVVFSTAMGLFLPYFDRGQGNIALDLAAGAVIGFLISFTQSKGEGRKISPSHTFAMILACIGALLGIRYIFLALPPLLGSTLLDLLMTAIIVFIEYRS